MEFQFHIRSKDPCEIINIFTPSKPGNYYYTQVMTGWHSQTLLEVKELLLLWLGQLRTACMHLDVYTCIYM